jgi:hypothetical protein
VRPREILEHRLATLEALLESRQPLTGGDGAVGDHLKSGWAAERSLIARILEETAGPNVTDTMALWRSRTERFVASSEDRVPGWQDARGQRWDARRVLALLDEMDERIAAWSGSATDPAP